MVRRTTFWSQDHRLSYEVFNNGFQSPIVEQVPDGKAPANLQRLHRRSDLIAHILECSVPLVHEQEFRLKVPRRAIRTVDLGVNVSIDKKKIMPAGVSKINESISPTNKSLCSSRDAGSNRIVGEVHASHVAV